MKHTSGPWIALLGKNTSPIQILARVPHKEFLSEDNVPICQTIADQREGQDPEANAQLIAAAPTMFDALVTIEQYIKQDCLLLDGQRPDLQFVLRALAQARGES